MPMNLKDKVKMPPAEEPMMEDAGSESLPFEGGLADFSDEELIAEFKKRGLELNAMEKKDAELPVDESEEELY